MKSYNFLYSLVGRYAASTAHADHICMCNICFEKITDCKCEIHNSGVSIGDVIFMSPSEYTSRRRNKIIDNLNDI